MKNTSNIFNIKTVLFLCLSVIMFNACDKDDETYEKTRLFRPVLNAPLLAEGNTIILNMGKLKGAIGYTIEVSRDTFNTIEYTIETDTNYVEIDENTVGEELFWNTRYQIRATAHEANAEFDSKISDLGSVRTEIFPSILLSPKTFDVIDVAARVTWEPAGQVVTGMKVFASTDLRLLTPLFPETPVTPEEFAAGEAFVYGLQPDTAYQIAIYSGTELRGWVNYKTKVADIDPTSPGVVDIRADESAGAVSSAVTAAADGAIILVKRGIVYNLPSAALNKSITIRAAYGFGEKRAELHTTGNWNIANGANIDHIRFIDLEIKGEDNNGDYVFNPSISSSMNINEIIFDNCDIGTFRGIMRLRGPNAIVNNFEIRNSIVTNIGGYGIFTCDTAPTVNTPITATVNNFKFVNSTFNKLQYLINSYNPSLTFLIESCTIANINTMFRYRGVDVTNGMEINNTIFGHKWDPTGTLTGAALAVVGTESLGLANTNIAVQNTYTTTDFSFVVGKEIATIPVGNAGTSQKSLWADAENNNFNIISTGFAGRSSAGDPRWRVSL